MIIVPSIKITGFGTLLLFVLFASIYLPSKLNETTNLKKKWEQFIIIVSDKQRIAYTGPDLNIWEK